MTQYQKDAKTETAPRESFEDEYEEPGLTDAIRFLYQRRVRLVFFFIAIFVIGSLAFFYSYFATAKTVEGIVGLSFRGIENREYPSGRKFSVEDFRSPAVLANSLRDAAISGDRISVRDLAAHLIVAPVIPPDIQNRWKKQEQAGQRREAYSPNEFRISIQLQGLTDYERIRLFDAVLSRYRESVKYDQESAKGFIYSPDVDYEKLAATYDFWDIPDFFRGTYNSFNEKLASMIKESLKYQDATYQLSFREIAKDLDTWERTRLQTVEALTYQGRLVKNGGLVLQRIQYRIQDLDIQARQKMQESNEAMRLLNVVDRPKGLVSGQLAGREGTPIVDVAALDKLLKGDYVRPVVERISKLQEEIQAGEEEKARLEKQLSLLPKVADANPGSLPPGYRDLTLTLSRELNEIIRRYDRLLEDYLKAAVLSLVALKQSPVVFREAYSPVIVLPGIALVSLMIAVMLLGFGHVLHKVRQEKK
jgi:hypothetical protein